MKTQKNPPINFIDLLSNAIYTTENIQRAEQYVLSRGLDPSLFRFPYTLTDSDPLSFYQFRDYYNPEIFCDCLYIPVTAVNNSKLLVGFDLRYLGKAEHRIRFVKFKRTPDTMMLYSTHNLTDIDPNAPILITEGAIDCESLRCLGYPVISPLTAQCQLRFCCFLRALSAKVYIGYDNDDGGRKATQKIIKHINISSETSKGFVPLIYSGQDPNWTLLNYGKDYLNSVLGTQINPVLY